LRTIKIVERILAALPIMLGVCIVVFYFMRLIPGDPVDIMLGEASNVTDEELARLKSQFELDKPIHEQLISYLSRIAQGDLGYSISRSAEVKDLILEALPATVELAISSMVFALIVAIPIGIISAVKHNSLTDRVSMAELLQVFLCRLFGLA
jgi:peptide/nickel transport system permease protein